MYITTVRLLMSILLFLLVSVTAFSQGAGPPPPGLPDPEPVPINEKIAVLVLGGILYGGFISARRKKM